jgi:hypothetical protein
MKKLKVKIKGKIFEEYGYVEGGTASYDYNDDYVPRVLVYFPELSKLLFVNISDLEIIGYEEI